MEPLEIRIELMRAGVKPSQIAERAKVGRPTVTNVIDRKTTSDRIQRMIAKAIGRKVQEVFPERYGKKAITPGLERLAG